MRLRSNISASVWILAVAVSAIGACDPPVSSVPASYPGTSTSATAEPTAIASSAVSAAVPMGRSIPDGNVERSKVADEFKWKLDPLFGSDDGFEKGLKEAADLRGRLIGFKGKLSRPTALRECLDLYFKTRLLGNRLTLYANLRLDTEVKSARLQSMSDRSLDAMNDLIAKAVFIRQEVLAMGEAAIKNAYATDPALGQYRPYLEEMRRRRSHALGPESEKVLALAGDNLWAEIDLNELPSDHEKAFHSTLADLPLPRIQVGQSEPVQLTLSNYNKFRISPDRQVRREAVEGFLATLRQYQHAFASALSGQARFNVFLARSRGYSDARAAYLDKDDISPAVYDNLLRTVGENLAPLHRYIRLRKKVMGLSELRLYDMYTPMVKNVDLRFTYEDAKRVLPEALYPLGDEYTRELRNGLDVRNGWLDLYPHKDKRSGAFCSNVFGIHPFVKMNYYEGLDDLSTLAHEFGHAMHAQLSMASQPYVTANYASFIAEIASTLNEKLLSDYLLAHARNDKEKLYLLNQLVDRLRTTIYRQTLFAEFEHLFHAEVEKGTPLTAEVLNDIYRKLIARYYGPELTIGANDEVEWAYVPHLYYKFYVFTYATGFSSGIALAQAIRANGASGRDGYLKMLKGGSSRPPLELLRGAGVDLAHPEAIAAATRLMDELLGQMEGILAKSGS